jgi:hypothetical protein
VYVVFACVPCFGQFYVEMLGLLFRLCVAFWPIVLVTGARDLDGRREETERESAGDGEGDFLGLLMFLLRSRYGCADAEKRKRKILMKKKKKKKRSKGVSTLRREEWVLSGNLTWLLPHQGVKDGSKGWV